MVGGQAYGMDGNMWWGWGHVVGCEGMWQGVGACGSGSGRVWGHVAGCGGHVAVVDVCGKPTVSLQHRLGHVAGCGGMWQGVPYAPTPCHMLPRPTICPHPCHISPSMT